MFPPLPIYHIYGSIVESTILEQVLVVILYIILLILKEPPDTKLLFIKYISLSPIYPLLKTRKLFVLLLDIIRVVAFWTEEASASVRTVFNLDESIT